MPVQLYVLRLSVVSLPPVRLEMRTDLAASLSSHLSDPPGVYVVWKGELFSPSPYCPCAGGRARWRDLPPAQAKRFRLSSAQLLNLCPLQVYSRSECELWTPSQPASERRRRKTASRPAHGRVVDADLFSSSSAQTYAATTSPSVRHFLPTVEETPVVLLPPCLPSFPFQMHRNSTVLRRDATRRSPDKTC
jgi:hypothetical protein